MFVAENAVITREMQQSTCLSDVRHKREASQQPSGPHESNQPLHTEKNNNIILNNQNHYTVQSDGLASTPQYYDMLRVFHEPVKRFS